MLEILRIKLEIQRLKLEIQRIKLEIQRLKLEIQTLIFEFQRIKLEKRKYNFFQNGTNTLPYIQIRQIQNQTFLSNREYATVTSQGTHCIK